MWKDTVTFLISYTQHISHASQTFRNKQVQYHSCMLEYPKLCSLKNQVCNHFSFQLRLVTSFVSLELNQISNPNPWHLCYTLDLLLSFFQWAYPDVTDRASVGSALVISFVQHIHRQKARGGQKKKNTDDCQQSSLINILFNSPPDNIIW